MTGCGAGAVEGSFNRSALEEDFVSDAVEALASVFAQVRSTSTYECMAAAMHAS